ncbi:hypothetical protein [Streptomyces sp. NPDC001068]|uniref:hypothetical protein n=1 Tax=Streptomyces sp. NPDC001068 TaxID=3364544 RepID=UPI00367B4344
MSSNTQASSSKLYQNIVESLAQAQTTIKTAQGEVESRRASLSHAYQGEDGVLFGQKLDEWHDEGSQILQLCALMQERLTEASSRDASTQQHNLSAVTNARTGEAADISISQNAYNAMTG